LGDLNFTMNKDEVWGVEGREDKLFTFFLDKMETHKLIDVEPIVMRPT
jgi:hypothetical protein